MTHNFLYLHSDILNDDSAYVTFAEFIEDEEDFTRSNIRLCVWVATTDELNNLLRQGLSAVLTSRTVNSPFCLSNLYLCPSEVASFVRDYSDVASRLSAVLGFTGCRADNECSYVRAWFFSKFRVEFSKEATEAVRGLVRRFYSAILVEAFRRADEVR